jgi:hypothetical protein
MVPLFSVQGHCLRHITIREAERMLEMRQAHRVSGRNKPLKVQLKALERADSNSPATITVGELLANAFAQTSLKGAQSHTALLGEDERRERERSGRTAEDYIERATTKVALWPLIGDTKAPRVGRQSL